jgi:hypothetical protein
MRLANSNQSQTVSAAAGLAHTIASAATAPIHFPRMMISPDRLTPAGGGAYHIGETVEGPDDFGQWVG